MNVFMFTEKSPRVGYLVKSVNTAASHQPFPFTKHAFTYWFLSFRPILLVFLVPACFPFLLLFKDQMRLLHKKSKSHCLSYFGLLFHLPSIQLPSHWNQGNTTETNDARSHILSSQYHVLDIMFKSISFIKTH